MIVEGDSPQFVLDRYAGQCRDRGRWIHGFRIHDIEVTVGRGSKEPAERRGEVGATHARDNQDLAVGGGDVVGWSGCIDGPGEFSGYISQCVAGPYNIIEGRSGQADGEPDPP